MGGRHDDALSGGPHGDALSGGPHGDALSGGPHGDALSRGPHEEPLIDLSTGSDSDASTVASYNDDRTVAYQDAFLDEFGGETVGGKPERTIIAAPSMDDEAPTMGIDADLPSLAALNDFSTVRNMDEEPELPVPRLGRGDLDGQTVAGGFVDFDSEPDRSVPDRASGLPAARRGALPHSAQSAAEEAMTELARDEVATEAAVAAKLPHPSGRRSAARRESEDGGFELAFERSGSLVHPSPLEAPPGEEDQSSYQDEYSALLMPKPLGGESAPQGGPQAIGSTNVPPASLSLSEMLAHPPQMPRSKLTAVATKGPSNPLRSEGISLGARSSAPPPSVRPASIRSASIVGRQIREVVRATEPPGIKLPRPDPAPPRLDLNSALDAAPLEPEVPVQTTDGGRRWLAPLLAGLSVLLLAFAVYLALPYVAGPVGPHLTIKTTPIGARVLVDGAPQKGVTPITITGLHPGVTYQIRLELRGFEAVVREVQLPQDGPLIWQIPLRPSLVKE